MAGSDARVEAGVGGSLGSRIPAGL